jgi:carboxypeptidase Taq
MQNFKVLKASLAEIFDLLAAAAVLRWDLRTYMPPGGGVARSFQIATLVRLAHEKRTSEEFHKTLGAAKKDVERLDPDSNEVRMVCKAERDFERLHKVPSEWVETFSRVTSLAHQAWKKARAESDFSQFQPHLGEVVKLRREYAEFFQPYNHPYDPLLDVFEPGMKTAEVSAVFDELRPQQIGLIEEIVSKGKTVDNSILRQHFNENKQWDFGIEVIKIIGYDFSRGRQDLTTHPFTIRFGVDDVRITTNLDPNDIFDGLSSTIHEAGHGVHAQGFHPSLDRSNLAESGSYAIGESQSRMLENVVGRSRSFWVAFYPRLQEVFPSQLGEVDLETFYRAINKVQPSLIRVDADEATYNLHIMLRFEIETALMENKLSVADLPEVWNVKMEDYLGVIPPNDAQGVLQDVHWSDGSIGYFPTYALGNLIASQLWVKLCEDIPDLEHQIEHARFDELIAWLRMNIHQHGAKFEPKEMLQRVLGGGLSSEPYIRYLRRKYEDIYGLN